MNSNTRTHQWAEEMMSMFRSDRDLTDDDSVRFVFTHFLRATKGVFMIDAMCGNTFLSFTHSNVVAL